MAINIDAIDYTDGVVHVFGDTSPDPDGVTETVTIVQSSNETRGD